MAQLTSRTELTEPADNDLLHIIDTSDTTDGALGTSKKIQHSNLIKSTAIALNTTHRTSNGTDHSYINQDVTTTGTPTFNSLTVTGSVVINEGGGDNDTRIEGDTEQNLFYVDAGNDRVGIGTASPANKFHIVGGGITLGIPAFLGTAGIAIKQSADAVTSGILIEASGSTNNGGLYYNSSALVLREGGFDTLAVDGGNVGIGTTSPGQILDCNDGSGNMIADGYDSHPSFSYKKENITDVGDVLPYLVASPPKRFNRKPHVSAEELREFAIKTHLEAWINEFGGEVIDGALQGDDYRGGKLKLIKDQKLLNLIDTEADRLREERRQEKKWQRKYVGLIIDDDNIINNLPEIIVKNDDDEIDGWNVDSYIGMLHKAIIELSKRIDKLEGVKL